MFAEYCDNSELHDLIIKVEDGCSSNGSQTIFFAHKLILAMNSPFFKA
jgi:hypothetical protein